MRWEKVPPINLCKNNSAAFIHELPVESISNVAGENNYVRLQVLTPATVLDREKQLGVVRKLTDIVAAAAKDPTLWAGLGYLLRNHLRVDGELTVTQTQAQTSSQPRGQS